MNAAWRCFQRCPTQGVGDRDFGTRAINEIKIVPLRLQKHAPQAQRGVTQGLDHDGYKGFVISINCHMSTVYVLVQSGHGKSCSKQLFLQL